MPRIRPFLRRAVMAAACLFVAGAQIAEAQEQSRAGRGALVLACRTDFQTLCAGTKLGRDRVTQCLREHSRQLSEGCRSAMVTARENDPVATPAPSLPAGVTVQRNVSYGSRTEQRMDVYRPQKANKAPIIVMVHGGAWTRGSKVARSVVENKVNHWLPKGYIFVSVDTRLAPNADPLKQASDVAAALARVQDKAPSWGGDPSKVVLMGHSAGAHLVALLSADRSIAEKAGARPWLGTVALDSAAYDVPAIMKLPHHPKLYDEAFGKDPAFWAKASPVQQAKGSLPPMLLVCSSLRRRSCQEAENFAAKAGGKAKVLPVALRHGPINVQLGLPGGDYTKSVDAFFGSIGLN